MSATYCRAGKLELCVMQMCEMVGVDVENITSSFLVARCQMILKFILTHFCNS